MKNLLFYALIFFAVPAYSQISATTTAGKKVILNTDGTWKYADGASTQTKPCQTNHTGNLNVKNNTTSDLYFYYRTSQMIGYDVQFIKVKSKSSKPINDLESTFGYLWIATTELQENKHWSEIKGIEKGKFVINDCDQSEITIDN